jgi:hypothetical protein
MSHGTLEKTETLSAVYQYVASRLESVDQRSSVLMVLSASFVSYLLTTKQFPVGQGADTVLNLLYRPSILISVAAFVSFYMSQCVRIKKQNDLISLIVFSEQDLTPLIERFRASSGEEVLEEVIRNQRLVGIILKKKAKYYSTGAFLFGVAVAFHVLQR